ncbi:MAG TPA: ABC transporter ATP-binding protein [Phycisphaerae bacterium]|nr:ABC transporter ATP-binding protein [Phycisphaerae bacterium]HPS52199.1 ABC transporter ATP-binding protein [Phycisphaerae bacterium]
MNDPEKHILSAVGLNKSFGRGEAANHVLRGIDIGVNAGEFVAVMGPSGCGKSTLLHILGLMTSADSGEIFYNGQAVTHSESSRRKLRRNHIGFIFQRFNLIGTLSAADNIRISLRIRGLKDDGRSDELLKLMHVSHVARRRPGQMSIGEQQRVAAARALAHKPAILFADEPTGNLDSENGLALLELFKKVNTELGQTIVMITHSNQAAQWAHRIIRMKDGKIDG